MSLSKNTSRTYQKGEQVYYPIEGSANIYAGAAVGENGSGYSRSLQAGDVFQGFAVTGEDNSSGSAGDKKVNVLTKGKILLEVAGVTIASNDRVAVYASDDDTFTTTATSNSLIGYVSQHVSAGKAIVEFDAALVRAASAE